MKRKCSGNNINDTNQIYIYWRNFYFIIIIQANPVRYRTLNVWKICNVNVWNIEHLMFGRYKMEYKTNKCLKMQLYKVYSFGHIYCIQKLTFDQYISC